MGDQTKAGSQAAIPLLHDLPMVAPYYHRTSALGRNPRWGATLDLGSRTLALPGTVTRVGLSLPDGLPFGEWVSLGETLKGVEGSILWWIGDWLLYGERSYGQMYSEALDATGKSYQTCADAKYVAQTFPFSSRLENLGWAHHREVAAVKDEAARGALMHAAAAGRNP